jgi:SIR2-like protein
LFQAIAHHGRTAQRKPAFEICKWNNSPKLKLTYFTRGSTFTPTVQTPIIYHLHGHKSVPESLVLTEDDYLDFLVAMSRDLRKFLPPGINARLLGTVREFVQDLWDRWKKFNG